MAQTSDLQAALDERLACALQSANYRISLANQRANAKLKYKNDLIYSANGGLFESSPELISFVSCLVASGKDSAVLIDTKGNPIEVVDIEEFLSGITDRYYQATNSYLHEYRTLQKARTPKALIGE